MRVKPHRIIVRHKAYLLLIITNKGIIWVVCAIKHNLGFMAELWKRAILHCDMDAFFASVEQLAHLQRQVDAWVATIDPARLLVVDASKSFTPAVLACILARIHLACEIPFASTGLTFSTP